MRFAVNDIVAAAPGYSKNVFRITDINPGRPTNPYSAVSLTTGKAYRVGDGNLAAARIGVADVVQTVPGAPPTEWGQHRALAEVRRLHDDSPDKERWEVLACLVPGDTLKVRVRGIDKLLTFRWIAERGYKYVFIADDAGTRRKYPLSMVVV